MRLIKGESRGNGIAYIKEYQKVLTNYSRRDILQSVMEEEQ